MPPDDPTNGRCWHCGGSGIRCCEFGADPREGYRFTENRGRRCTVATAAGVVQAERETPDRVELRLIAGGDASALELPDDAGVALVRGLAGLYGLVVDVHA